MTTGFVKRWMNRYRGTSGWRGWLVLRLDVLWVKRMMRIARRELRKETTHHD